MPPVEGGAGVCTEPGAAAAALPGAPTCSKKMARRRSLESAHWGRSAIVPDPKLDALRWRWERQHHGAPAARRVCIEWQETLSHRERRVSES